MYFYIYVLRDEHYHANHMSSCTNRIIFLPGGKTKKTTDGPLEAATAVKEAGSALAALASRLFDPPRPLIIGEPHCFATFRPFRAPGSSFFGGFLFLTLLWLFPSLLFVGPYCRKFDFQTSFDQALALSFLAFSFRCLARRRSLTSCAQPQGFDAGEFSVNAIFCTSSLRTRSTSSFRSWWAQHDRPERTRAVWLTYLRRVA